MADLTQDQLDALTVQIESLKNEVSTAWNSALGWYNAMSFARDKLGMPLVSGDWTAGDQQSMSDLQSAVGLAVTAAQDAIDGKRKVNFDPTVGQIYVESLDTDPFRMAPGAGGTLSFLETRANAPLPSHPGSGEVGSFIDVIPEVLPWIVAGPLAVTYFIIKNLCKLYETHSNNTTTTDLQKACIDFVAQGKGTIADCQKLTSDIQTQQQQIIAAQNRKPSETANPGYDTLQTALWVILGLGIVGTGAYILTRKKAA